jgi:hypothetical protein
MRNFILYLFLLLFSTLSSKAQESFPIKGIVFKKGGSERITSAEVRNITQKTSTQTDEFGTFSILVSLNDSLVISKSDYQEAIKVVLKRQNMIIYLNPTISLEEVTVKAKSVKQEQKEILEGYKSKGVYNNGKTPFLMYIFNPLTALQNLLGNDAKNARTFYRYVSRENGENVVDTRFNIALIKNNTSINESDIAEFMYLYRPKYIDVQYWNDYDAINYIKKSYQKYKKTK